MFIPFFNSAERQLRQECTEWILAHRHQLLAYALRQGDDMTDAEHLLSEVAGKVVEALSRGHIPQTEWMPYTLRAIHNAAVTQRRRNARRLETERQFTQEQQLLSSAETDDQLQPLRRALCRLPMEQQELIRLRIWEELTFVDIGRRLRLPESTVRLHYSRALDMLKREMKGGFA